MAGRNAAFTDLLFSSGLRLREVGCLLTLEVPEAVGGHCSYVGRLRAWLLTPRLPLAGPPKTGSKPAG